MRLMFGDRLFGRHFVAYGMRIGCGSGGSTAACRERCTPFTIWRRGRRRGYSRACPAERCVTESREDLCELAQHGPLAS